MKTILNVFLIFMAAVPLFAKEELKTALEWTPDYEAAVQTAKKENKSVFLLFTGSTWCPPCKYLEANILSSDEFKKFAGENLVCVMVDFKRGGRGPSDPKFADKHNALARQFSIVGFPTVFIINPNTDAKESIVGLKYDNTKDFIAWIKSFIKK